MFFKSIRFRILLWYMLFLTLTLLSFSSVVYGVFDKMLYDDFDDLLNSRAEGVADSIMTYWSGASADRDNFITMAKVWVEEKSKDPDLMKIFVRILSSDGKTIVSSKAMPSIAPMAKCDWDDILNGEDDFETVRVSSDGGKGTRFRIYSKPVMLSQGSVSYIVQVAGPMRLVRIVMNNLELVLFILLPLTVVLAGIPGVILVGLTLKPVNKMVDAMRQITTENLKLKIHMPDTKDEIKKLADSLNEMIERLDRSFSSQQRFIQDIYNELKKPVDSLKQDIERALNKKDLKEECEELVPRIAKEMDSFSRVVDGLLTLSQFDNNQVTLEIRKVNLSALIDTVLREAGPLLEEKDITVSSSCPKALVVDGDRAQLKKLFGNILNNAIKYNYRGGGITVTGRRDRRMAHISISDTGAGIDEDDLPYVFDRFYQTPGHRAQKDGSFGLGLSTAKTIANAHKGTISVESQESKGSVFTVSLPISYPA